MSLDLPKFSGEVVDPTVAVIVTEDHSALEHRGSSLRWAPKYDVSFLIFRASILCCARSEVNKATECVETIHSLVSALILLERDATAAYVRILDRLADLQARQEIGRFLESRQRRLAELTKMSFTLRLGAPGESAARYYLSTGRIALDSLIGDGEILNAMRAGECETVAAYQRAGAHPQASMKGRAMFERSLRDALQHCFWVENAARAAAQIHKAS